MDKKEAHEIWLTLNEVCVEHKDCTGCSFNITFDNRQICAVNHKRINDIAHILFNAAYEEQTPCTPPEHVGPIVVKATGPSHFDLHKPVFTGGVLEPVGDSLDNVIQPSIKHDNVNSPKHYCKGGLECIEVIKAQLTPEQYQGYLYGNVLKYMWRWPDKNGLEDLRKAEHYLKWLIEEVNDNG